MPLSSLLGHFGKANHRKIYSILNPQLTSVAERPFSKHSSVCTLEATCDNVMGPLYDETEEGGDGCRPTWGQFERVCLLFPKGSSGRTRRRPIDTHTVKLSIQIEMVLFFFSYVSVCL